MKKLLLAVLPALSVHALTAQNFSADFNLEKVHVEENMPVGFWFEDASSASFWQWEFEGGTPSVSNLRSPVVVFEKHGTYKVKLTYGNSNGQTTVIKDSYSHVYRALRYDFLNFPLPGDTVVYEDPNGGYLTGTNYKGTLGYANKFISEQSAGNAIINVLYWFGIATGGNQQISLVVWDADNTGKPGNIIAEKTVNLTSIFDNVKSEIMTIANFDFVETGYNYFFVGFYLPDGLDTLAIISNKDGDTNPGIAWEMLADSTWVPMNDPINSRGINIALAIFPYMMEYINSIPRETNNQTFHSFPNPASDYLNFTSENKNERIQILDLSGRIIMESNHTQVKVSNLAPGVYLSRIITGNGDFIEKFVKN